MHGRPEWDSRPWHYVPPALKGVVPVTAEPWAQDQKRCALTNTVEADERTQLKARGSPLIGDVGKQRKDRLTGSPERSVGLTDQLVAK